MASAAGPSLSKFPWELRDEKFRDSQAKATAKARNNGQRSGPNSLPSLQYQQTAESDDAGECDGETLQALATKAADPSLARGIPAEAKTRMIEMFAQFQSLSDVAKAMKSEFGLALDMRTVEAYNPDSHRCRVGKRLKSLFNSLRKAYVEESAKVAVAHQAHRLRLIGTIVDKATTAKDFGNALKGLELAAKEMGSLSQKVEHSGTVAHIHGSVEEARRELADRLKALVPAIDIAPEQVSEGSSVQNIGAETNLLPRPLATDQETEGSDND